MRFWKLAYELHVRRYTDGRALSGVIRRRTLPSRRPKFQRRAAAVEEPGNRRITLRPLVLGRLEFSNPPNGELESIVTGAVEDGNGVRQQLGNYVQRLDCALGAAWQVHND